MLLCKVRDSSPTCRDDGWEARPRWLRRQRAGVPSWRAGPGQTIWSGFLAWELWAYVERKNGKLKNSSLERQDAEGGWTASVRALVCAKSGWTVDSAANSGVGSLRLPVLFSRTL